MQKQSHVMFHFLENQSNVKVSQLEKKIILVKNTLLNMNNITCSFYFYFTWCFHYLFYYSHHLNV